MHFFTLSVLALTLGTTFANPTPRSPRVPHEKRQNGGLIKRSRADPTLQVPVRIALTQNNIDLGIEQLLDISDPDSANFGKHLNSSEVGNLFRPSKESIEAVRIWLHGSGIDTERHSVSPGKGWLKFHASVEELESLLSAEYHIYEHSATQESHVGCDEYHLPAHVTPHIDFITPSVSTLRIGSKKQKQKRGKGKSLSPAALNPIVRTAGAGAVPNVAEASIPCYAAVTPDCLRKLYNIPKGSTNFTGNQVGIFEDGDFYDQSDLDQTFAAVAPNVPQGTHPTLNGIDGGTAPVAEYGGIESQLDMSIILSLVHPQGAILYQVDDLLELYLTSGFGNTFLDALDASYCTFEGGDDPTIDPQYPDTAPLPPILQEEGYPNGTWNSTEMCGFYKPANVISISYGLGETAYSQFYLDRQCQEYMKLSLQGTSVILASGDSGVSDRDACIVPESGDPYDDTGAFSPSYPASCPWITSVGATQYNADDRTETAVNTPAEGFWSGGGFSNYWPRPAYQNSTITNYFAKTPPPYNNLTVYGTPYYNASGRAYPDVAAIGQNIFLYTDTLPSFVGGTSASAPIFASIITLINEKRLKAGKSRVGFLNPTLYKNPHAFTDITTGSNPGCGTNGFDAVKGWDPVTGLGTPKYQELLDVFMALP